MPGVVVGNGESVTCGTSDECEGDFVGGSFDEIGGGLGEGRRGGEGDEEGGCEEVDGREIHFCCWSWIWALSLVVYVWVV